MPGNEVGDRVHNFFDQGNLSQDQSHAQLVEGNWQLFNQNQWSGSERQTTVTSENYGAQQADFERTQGNQLSLGAHGSNFIQSSSKPEFLKNSSQLNSNGFMHSPHIFPPRQNEPKFPGTNSEPDRHNLMSRGRSILESEQRSTSYGGPQFPMNFNFLSNHQQMGGQPPVPRPQSAINDAHLMQQHLMLKQMQEVHRQHQLQQLEVMHRNAASPIAYNSNPLHNASRYQSQAGNVNWMPVGPTLGFQGYSNGLIISPEQSQTMGLRNLIPQQASHSLFGVPISNSRTPNLFSHNVDKSTGAHVAPPGSFFYGNQYNPFPEQMPMQDGSNVSGSISEGNSFFKNSVNQGLGNVPISEGGTQNSGGGSELEVPGKSVTPPATSQPLIGLDPTEEKILYGGDDNIWDGFGGSPSVTGTNVNRLDSTDALNGFSFMQSGTWSALMQSAVGETSSSDAAPEELSGLDCQNSKLQYDNKEMGSRVVTTDAGTPNCFDTSVFSQSFSHQAGSQLSHGRKWLDCNKPNSYAETENATKTDDTGSWSHQHNTFGQLNLNFIDSVPDNGPVVSSNQVDFHGRNVSTNTERLESAPNFNVASVSSLTDTMVADRNDLDLWKPVNSYVKSKGSDKVLHNLNEGPTVSDSSVSIPNHGSATLHETRTDNQTDNLNESLSLPGGQEKLPCQTVKKPTVGRKFQYHPMGDVDMDVESCVAEKHAKSQTTSQHFSSVVKGLETQTRFFGSERSDSMDMEQACVSGFQGPVKMPHGVSSASATFVRPGEITSTNKHVSSSQNMLQFLNMVDQSKEQNVIAPQNLSNTTSYEHDGFNQSRSSASHGFNLQLAPPSQGVASPNFHTGFQNPSRPTDSPNLGELTSDKGEKSHPWLGSVSSPQCLPPQMKSRSDRPHMTSASGETVNNKYGGPFQKGAPHDHQISDSKDLSTPVQSVNNAQQNLPYMNQSGMRGSMNQVQGPPPAAIMTGMSRNDNMWISQSHPLFAKGHNVSQTNYSSQDKRDEQDGPTNFDALTSQGAIGRNEPLFPEAQSSGETEDESQEEEPTTENPVLTKTTCEKFHQSFKSTNYVADNNYSSPNQMQVVKSTESDSIHRESKRLKGSDDGLNHVVTDSSVIQPSISAGNSNISTFPPQSGDGNTTFRFPHGVVGSQDAVFVRNGPQKFVPGSVSGIDYSGISPEMVPSRVDQYGTFKNGQMSVPRIPVNKNAEEKAVSGTSNELGPHSSVLPLNPVGTPEIASNDQPFSAYPSRESAPSLASIRRKKRKTATSDLVSWDEEVRRGIERLPSMSLAETNWARSSNRLVEKVEYETDNNDDASLIIKPKKRLILTAQLMQQVFRPPSAGVLLLDARTSYEVILYSLARLALGGACSQIHCVEAHRSTHIGNGNLLTEKVKTSERIRDQYFSKVVEDFISRAKELEDVLVSLDKRASILDIRLDTHDLERFSVINRFARFHGRSQVDGADNSSSSDTTTMAQNPCPQRCVSAIPMPKSVPERVHCHSL